MHPCQKIDVLGIEIDSMKITWLLTPEKVQKVVETCQNLLRSHSTTLREGTKSCWDLSESSQKLFYNSSRIHQSYGFFIIHNTSSGTSNDSVKISSITTICVSKEKNELPLSNNIKHQVKNRVNLVHRDLEVLQWPKFFSIEPTSNYSNRCFPSL